MARLLIVEDSLELASLVASAARDEGLEATVTHTGTEAFRALRQGGFALALVDLVLPDMSGKDVLAELKARGVPAVAMSGIYRGERFAQETTAVFGARAFFEKPFKMKDLMAAVLAALGSAPMERKAPVAPTPLEEVLEELTPLDDEGPEAAGPKPEAIPFAARERVWSAQSEPAKRQAPKLPEWSSAGKLAESPVPRLLNAYYEARHTGELRLRRDKVLKVIAFEEGRPVYAVSNVSQERFGALCVRKGLLKAEEAAELAREAKESKARTAELALRAGKITPDQRRQVVEEQVRQVIESTFAWEDGEYQLVPTRSRSKEWLPLSLFPGELILEGAQKTQTLTTLRRLMPPQRRLFPSADPPYPLYELKLSGAQALLLVHADGSKTVQDLLALTEMNERDALATLLGLEWAGQLHERTEERSSRRITFGL